MSCVQHVMTNEINLKFFYMLEGTSKPAITCSKLTVETLKQGVKYVQS